MLDQMIEQLMDDDIDLEAFLEENFVKNKNLPVTLVHRWVCSYLLFALQETPFPFLGDDKIHLIEVMKKTLMWNETDRNLTNREYIEASRLAYRIAASYDRYGDISSVSLLSEAVFMASTTMDNYFRAIKVATSAVWAHQVLEDNSLTQEEIDDVDITEMVPNDAIGILIELIDELQMSRQQLFQLLWNKEQQSKPVLQAWQDQTEDGLFGE